MYVTFNWKKNLTGKIIFIKLFTIKLNYQKIYLSYLKHYTNFYISFSIRGILVHFKIINTSFFSISSIFLLYQTTYQINSISHLFLSFHTLSHLFLSSYFLLTTKHYLNEAGGVSHLANFFSQNSNYRWDINMWLQRY